MFCGSQLDGVLHFNSTDVITVSVFFSFFNYAACMANLSVAPVERIRIGLERIDLSRLFIGQIIMTYLSMKSVLLRMLTDNIFTTLSVLIAQRSPSITKRSICAKVMIGSFLAEHRFRSCSFFIFSSMRLEEISSRLDFLVHLSVIGN